jgi:hypothetical protein
MIEPVIRDRNRAGCHGFDAFAITGSDQTGDIGWTHSTPCLVIQGFQIKREPTLKIRLPVFVHHKPRLKMASHESRNQRHANSKRYTSAKVVVVNITHSQIKKFLEKC